MKLNNPRTNSMTVFFGFLDLLTHYSSFLELEECFVFLFTGNHRRAPRGCTFLVAACTYNTGLAMCRSENGETTFASTLKIHK